MPKFKFRLEAALKIAERTLEEKQRSLAQELEKLTLLQRRCREQELSWQRALVGQKEAIKGAAQDLGRWQQYAQHQFDYLCRLENQTKEQEKVVLEHREYLLEAHKEVEKLNKLKEKRKAQFLYMELRREQGELDEIGQIVFTRNIRMEYSEETGRVNDIRNST